MNATTSQQFSAEKTLLVILGQMEQLIRVYEDERTALELRDMKAFVDIQGIKVQLATECEQHIAEVQAHASLTKLASPAIKERIYMAQKTLNALALESQRNCSLRAETTRRLQQRLLDAARYLVNKNQSRYTKRGKTAGADKNRPVATAINEAI